MVVVESDAAAVREAGQKVLNTARRVGIDSEMIATGSPRKRYDKAVKSGAAAILSLSDEDGRIAHRLKGDDEALARLDPLFNAIAESMSASPQT